MNDRRREKMGWNATWSMAVGGMIGGGIFSVLGVVIALAGPLAWASFVLAGLIALATASSYVRLSAHFGEGGGAFAFLREIDHRGFAGSLSWVLIVGYVLTVSVYASTFANYVGEVLGVGDTVVRVLAAVAVAALVAVNLVGVAEASGVEIVAVWAKLAILLGLAAFGLARFSPERYAADVDTAVLAGAVVGAASIFMAYEGFQLLTYDYDEIERPERTLPRALLPAVAVVIVVYVLVTLGSVALVGERAIVEKKEVALALAGEEAFGTAGKVLVTIAAAFSTVSAINATLFATARLAGTVASHRELPRQAGHRNARGVPDRAVTILGAIAATLAVLGSLTSLVEAASLTFLFTFATVNAIAALRLDSGRLVSWLGAAGAAVAGVVLAARLAATQPLALAALGALVLAATVGRPLVLRRLGANA